MFTIGMCDVCLHGFHVILRRYMVRATGYKEDVEVDYNITQTRVDVGLLSQDQNYWVWLKGGGVGS